MASIVISPTNPTDGSITACSVSTIINVTNQSILTFNLSSTHAGTFEDLGINIMKIGTVGDVVVS